MSPRATQRPAPEREFRAEYKKLRADRGDRPVGGRYRRLLVVGVESGLCLLPRRASLLFLYVGFLLENTTIDASLYEAAGLVFAI